MCNHREQNCGCAAAKCPFERLMEMNRMCGCTSGVLADAISSCDSFCNANANAGCGGHCGCHCKRKTCGCKD